MDHSERVAKVRGWLRRHPRYQVHFTPTGGSWQNLVERLFGELKTYYGLTPLRVRGLAKVQLHADLTILARLSQALLRERAMLLAA